MRVSHEIPRQLFPIHDLICDYPYILAHLLCKELPSYDETYASFYKKKIKASTLSYLDNSAYELGRSIDTKLLFELGEEYQPSHIVLPDSYGNYQETVDLVEDYLNKYADKSTPEFFAVLQGNTLQEYLNCYAHYASKPKIDIIGVNFRKLEDSNRLEFLKIVHRRYGFRKKIHLLGCDNPGEFLDYPHSFKQKIYSVDTSSPIIHGWNNNSFIEDGCPAEKLKIKLADNLDIKLSEEQLQCIYHNVKMFKTYIA